MIGDLEFWRLMEQGIHEKRRAIRNNLGNGGASDFASYRYGVGELAALKDVLHMAREVYARMTGQPVEPVPDDEPGDDFPI